jgi:hypothetical protein
MELRNSDAWTQVDSGNNWQHALWRKNWIFERQEKFRPVEQAVDSLDDAKAAHTTWMATQTFADKETKKVKSATSVTGLAVAAAEKHKELCLKVEGERLHPYYWQSGTVRVFIQNLALDDAISSYACSLQPLGSPLLLPLSS